MSGSSLIDSPEAGWAASKSPAGLYSPNAQWICIKLTNQAEKVAFCHKKACVIPWIHPYYPPDRVGLFGGN
jgi:hypothetical protein